MHVHAPTSSAGSSAATAAAVPRARVLLTVLLLASLAAALAGAWWLWPDPDAAPPRIDTAGPGVTYVRADVVEVHPDATGMDQATIRLADGEEVDAHVPPSTCPSSPPATRCGSRGWRCRRRRWTRSATPTS
ncbi:hypothetical protein [Cellulomonas sp. JZ18]|uniref:hypothetical protein n=1 Tax=Cellulomonas sp. JZ18 TaxID=2654191 RepID=UPI001E51F9C5|nr:hypothetical protein [Cellulomonas sp. JZ18]